MYETATFADASGRLGPMLATNWRQEEDGLAWRLRIRPSARFHSGRVCDDEAVAQAYRLHSDPVASPVNAFFWRPVESVAAADSEVVIRLRHPCIGLPNLLRSWHAAVHNQDRRAQLGDAYGRDGNIDGTGPFRFARWKPGEGFEVTRWDEYAGSPVATIENRGPAYLDGVRWVPLLEERDRARALDEGAVDCVQNVSLLDVDLLQANPDLEVISFQQSALVYLAIDHEHREHGFHDLRVRQALSHAIDRSRLVAEELGGHGWPQYGPIPSQSPWYEPEVERFNGFDPQRARTLLDEAGFRADGAGLRLRFRALVVEDATVARAAEAVKAMLREIGVELELAHTSGFEAFYGALGSHPPAFISKWFWPDPLDAIIGFVSSWSHEGPNWQRAADAEIDAACRDWQQAPDVETQKRASSGIQLLCAERLPLIPLFSPAAVWAHHKRVHGWRPTPTNLYPLYNDVWLENA